jgi:uncharacterized protein (TIGR02145 family)
LECEYCGPAPTTPDPTPTPVPVVKADFSGDKTAIAKGETVNFTDKSANNPTKWDWKFEGGTPATSSEQNPIITYNTSGSFKVELTATDKNGKVDTKTASAYITVSACGTLTDIDGNSYKLVEINGKCWMAENLRTSKYSDGSAITTGLDSASWVNTTSGAYAIYDDSEVNHTKYGKLYNYHAAANPKGLCPKGWHVPAKAEFDAMVTFLGGENEAGGALRTTTGWTAPNTGDTNSSGFSAVPGGFRTYQNAYNGIDYQGYFMALSTNQIYSYLILNGETGYMFGFEGGTQAGNSCRCTQD